MSSTSACGVPGYVVRTRSAFHSSGCVCSWWSSGSTSIPCPTCWKQRTRPQASRPGRPPCAVRQCRPRPAPCCAGTPSPHQRWRGRTSRPPSANRPCSAPAGAYARRRRAIPRRGRDACRTSLLSLRQVIRAVMGGGVLAALLAFVLVLALHEGRWLLGHLHPLISVDTTPIGPVGRITLIASSLRVLGVKVIILIKGYRISLEICEAVRDVGADEIRSRRCKVVVDLDAAREGADRAQHVDRVVGGVILQHRVVDAVGLEPEL